MRRVSIFFLLLTIFSFIPYTANSDTRDYMISHPENYIEIPDWSVYSAWGGVAILHNLRIVNHSDVEYKNIKIRIYYSSSSAATPANVISQQTGVLPITLPPRSEGVYFKEGITFGANSQFMNPHRVQILGAEHNP